MSVNWLWKSKIGEMEIEKEWNGETTRYTLDVYKGNCLYVCIYESEEMKKNGKYQFYSFINDIQHLKNCLGLSKEYKENILQEIKMIRFDISMREKQKYTFNDILNMSKLFARAGIPVYLDNYNYYKINE